MKALITARLMVDFNYFEFLIPSHSIKLAVKLKEKDPAELSRLSLTLLFDLDNFSVTKLT